MQKLNKIPLEEGSTLILWSRFRWSISTRFLGGDFHHDFCWIEEISLVRWKNKNEFGHCLVKSFTISGISTMLTTNCKRRFKHIHLIDMHNISSYGVGLPPNSSACLSWLRGLEPMQIRRPNFGRPTSADEMKALSIAYWMTAALCNHLILYSPFLTRPNRVWTCCFL